MLSSLSCSTLRKPKRNYNRIHTCFYLERNTNIFSLQLAVYVKEKKHKVTFNLSEVYNCIQVLMKDFWTILVAISILEWEINSEVFNCSREP